MTFFNTKSKTLFETTARTAFIDLTGRSYDNMLARIKRKGFYGLPFTKDIFREFMFKSLGDSYDGFIICGYCNGAFALGEIAVDHKVPLSRGGGVELDNLDLACRPCNFRKGAMLPGEYIELLQFIDAKIPLAKTDILTRLQISVQLAAGEAARKAKKRKEEASGAAPRDY